MLVIFTDDQGYHDVGCYGSEIATPHIDGLASEGIRFTQFYAASSICTPSRYGLLTGRYPHRSRDRLLGALMFLDETDSHRGLRPGERTYVSLLHDAGYQTALVGKWHLGHGEDVFWPTRHGFETFFGHTAGCVDFFTLDYGNIPDWYRGRDAAKPAGYATDVITDEAIAVLRRQATQDRPFYLHLAYNAPHFGKGWDSASETTVNVMQPKPTDLAKVAHLSDPLRRAFAAKVVGMDDSVGRVLDELGRLDLADDTLVIFMTDHGGDQEYGGSNLPYRGNKATLFEGGLRVPCIVRWPGHISPGTTTDAVACAIDWFPTLMEIAGLPTKGMPLDGVSLLPILKGDSTEIPRDLVWRTGAHAELNRSAWYAARSGNWKWVRPPGEPGLLFDLADDPHETQDLAESRPEVADRLRRLAEES